MGITVKTFSKIQWEVIIKLAFDMQTKKNYLLFEISPKNRWFILLCFLFASIQISSAWNWGLPGQSSWSVDSIGLSTLKWAKGGFKYSNDFDARYPHGQRYILAVAYTPLIAWYLISGQINIESAAADLNNTTLRTAFIRMARTTTICMAIGIMFFVFRIAQQLGPNGSGLLAAGSWTGIYLNVYYSQTANLEIPYIFWTMFALQQTLQFQQTTQRKHLYASAILAAYAVATKDQAAGLILAFPLLLIFSPFQKNTKPLSGQVKPIHSVILWITISIIAYGTVTQAFIRPINFLTHVKLIFSGALQPYQSNLGLLELSMYHSQQFLVSANPLICAFMVFSLAYCLVKSSKTFLWLLIPIFSYHFIFMLQSNLTGARHLLPHLTFFAIISGTVGATVLSNQPHIQSIVIPVLTFIFYFSGLPMSYQLWNDPRTKAENWLKKRPDVYKSLATYSILDPYLPQLAQAHAKKIVHGKELSRKIDQEYLICASGWYSRFSHDKDRKLAEKWKNLLSGNLDFSKIKTFTSSPTSGGLIDMQLANLAISGFYQTIHILKKKVVAKFKTKIAPAISVFTRLCLPLLLMAFRAFLPPTALLFSNNARHCC